MVTYRMFASYFIILVSLATIESAKILAVVPTPVLSHQLMLRPLVQELINRDHEVTIITTDPVYPQGESPKNLNEIDIKNVSYALWNKRVSELAKTDISNLNKVTNGLRVFSEIFIEQLKEESVQKLLRDKTIKYDLLIVENTVQGNLIFSYIFKAPMIVMNVFGVFPGQMKMMGSVTQPFLYPTHYHQNIYNLTVWEKIYELCIDIAYNNMHEEHDLDNDRRLKALFGIDTPELNELRNNVHMLFLNVNPTWLHNPPATPNTVYTSGFHKPEEKMLPKDIQSYLDSSIHGVIYFSFGSVFKTSEIPSETLEIFVKVLSRLPNDILWKWDEDVLPGKSENIRIYKWLPQCDVLRHPNVKLFITHGGIKSVNEAINAGVPLIGIPHFADQGYNIQKCLYFKIGIKLDYLLLTIEDFGIAINTILTNYDRYKRNIIQLRTQLYDKPKPTLEHVTWWIEYVLRHGGVRHLRAPAANMSWAQYYELDTVLLVLTGLMIIGTVLLVTVYTCLRSILRLINFKVNQPIQPTKYKSIYMKQS